MKPDAASTPPQTGSCAWRREHAAGRRAPPFERTCSDSAGRLLHTTQRPLLHTIFEEQADARPDAVALLCGDEATTYADLEGRANRLARYLRLRGVTRGSHVGLLLPRSVDAYVAMLGILKAGAAYVPLDPDAPADRLAYILEDSGARTLVTNSDLAMQCPRGEAVLVRVDTDRDTIAALDGARLPHSVTGVHAHDPCYVIYTSGSTGRPKGVVIEHGSASHLVHAEGRIYRARIDDRIYQGAPLSFDLSVEEIWLALHAGATLVAATAEVTHAGPDLARFLTERRVTVLSCVPTMLSMMEQDVPTLRLVILGGESCPQELVSRWARPGRRIVNTYGPTETTVIATYAELSPDAPVTIGRPVPGYEVHLLDWRLRAVPDGCAGEICIVGPGVARGYVGRPEETRERFVRNPLAPGGSSRSRMYRTGDLARLDDDGNLVFLGRVDSQVKIRGFRVELTEIESVLMEVGARAAACTVREDVSGVQQIVAFVTPRDADVPRLRAQLLDRLPPYMVPSIIEPIADLPRLPSGKLDRSRLPAPQGNGAHPGPRGRRPRTRTERLIARVWEPLFSPQRVSLDDDFFVDLGGHSLLAARMVSELRKHPRYARVSMLDVYEHPTVASLAAALDVRFRTAVSDGRSRRSGRHASGNGRSHERRRYLLAGVLQPAGLYAVFGLRVLQWVLPYLVFLILHENGTSVLTSIAWAAAAEAALFPSLLVVAVAVKWIVLGRVRPGRHPLWGGYYLRWWFVQSVVSVVPLDFLSGTPLLPFVYRLFGVRVGRGVHLETDNINAFDVIAIGDMACIDEDASLRGFTVEDGELIIGSVVVGRKCFVGARSILCEGSVMDDDARLEDLTLLPRGGHVPSGESWAGSPARRVDAPVHPLPPPVPRGAVRRAATSLIYLGLVITLPVLVLVAIAPGVAFLIWIDPVARPLAYLAATPLVGASFVLLLATEVILLKWLLVGRVRAGTYPVHGSFYVRHWMVDHLLALSMEVIAPIHATLYVLPWYRALGARLGRFVELSTATAATPDLLDIADGGTIADEVSLGKGRVEGGWMTVAPTKLGRRAFAGNSAVVPAGTTLGDGSLLGVLSLAPSAPGEAARPGTSWLGSPPFQLPRRQESTGFSEARTYAPPRRLQVARGAFEILRVTLPPAGFIVVAAAVIQVTLALWDHLGAGATLALLPLLSGACAGLAALAVVVAKWMIIGRYRPFVRPMWSLFVWRLELVNALYEFLATPLVLEALQGTPFLAVYLRLLGARIGHGAYLQTTGFLEWDLVTLGDRVALNDDCVMQTHLFEDRVLKASSLTIGEGCTVGAASVVLYDSSMEDGSRLDALSLLMKGETLLAGTAWVGIPAAWGGETAAHALPRRA